MIKLVLCALLLLFKIQGGSASGAPGVPVCTVTPSDELITITCTPTTNTTSLSAVSTPAGLNSILPFDPLLENTVEFQFANPGYVTYSIAITAQNAHVSYTCAAELSKRFCSNREPTRRRWTACFQPVRVSPLVDAQVQLLDGLQLGCLSRRSWFASCRRTVAPVSSINPFTCAVSRSICLLLSRHDVQTGDHFPTAFRATVWQHGSIVQQPTVTVLTSTLAAQLQNEQELLITGLANGVAYNLTMSVQNALGWGPETAPWTFVPGSLGFLLFKDSFLLQSLMCTARWSRCRFSHASIRGSRSRRAITISR